jgi:hypothetical protein
MTDKPVGHDAVSLPQPRVKEIVDWLRNESEDRMKNALARRDSKGNRNATHAELKAEKLMAEKMFGRKLDLVSTKAEDNRQNYDMQERIAAKYEAQAGQLSGWADFLVASLPVDRGAPDEREKLRPVVIRTEDGFGVMCDGEILPVHIGFMRVSEVRGLQELIDQIVAKVAAYQAGAAAKTTTVTPCGVQDHADNAQVVGGSELNAVQPQQLADEHEKGKMREIQSDYWRAHRTFETIMHLLSGPAPMVEHAMDKASEYAAYFKTEHDKLEAGAESRVTKEGQ